MADNENTPLKSPWLVAVWPGMGQVAISAGYYLIAKLHMELFAEVNAEALFDLDAVEIEEGVIRPGSLPRSRFFVHRDPAAQHDLIVFIGEAQPPLGKHMFCRHVVELAKKWKVERIFTFAAMATDVSLKERERVYCTASSAALLESLKPLGLVMLREGRISGLNGVLLGVAMQAGIEAVCLLGEMPHYFTQVPYPKASLAVLKVFQRIAEVKLDLSELEEHARIVNERLGDLLQQIEKSRSEEINPEAQLPTETEGLDPADRERIERLFTEAASDRSKAYELKRELDRLGIFAEYEDRFLDLFRKKE
jgi:proteasome assembly chaperone (PAC2) family protein